MCSPGGVAGGSGGPAGAGVGSGIAGASQSGIGAAPGSGGGISGRAGGQMFGGTSHNYGSRFGTPARGSSFSQPVRRETPTVTPTMDVPAPQTNVGPSSEIGALVAQGVDPGLAAALVGAPIGRNFGGVVGQPAPGTANQGTKGDYGGPTIGGPPGTAVGSTKGDYGGPSIGVAPGTANQAGKGDFSGFRGSTQGQTSSTNPVGVRGVGRKGDFGAGFPGRRGDYGGSPARGIQGAASSDLPGSSGTDTMADTQGPTFPGSDAMLDQAFDGLRRARDYFAGQEARRGFQASRPGGVGGGAPRDGSRTQRAIPGPASRGR